MANILYDNCFISSYKTKVLEVVEENGLYWHYLEETIFYVESGGMDSDAGLINQHRVIKLKKEHNKVWHLLKVKLSGKVDLSIDFHARLVKSQVHTSQHLISGIMKNVYGIETLSHHVKDYENDIEFATNEISERQLHELQVIVNGLIRDDLMVKIFYPTNKELEKYKIKNLYEYDEVRMVKIGNISTTPCGCIHVPSLRYIQMIKILYVEKSSHGVKMKYVCGDQLLQNFETYYNVLDKTGRLLAQPFDFIEFGVLKLMQENKSLAADLQIIKTQYCDALCESLNHDVPQFKLFESMDLKTFNLLGKKYKQYSNHPYLFLLKQDKRIQVMVANFENSDALFKQIANKFNLHGGGSSDFAQGGGTYIENMEEAIQEMFSQKI